MQKELFEELIGVIATLRSEMGVRGIGSRHMKR